MPPSGSPGHPGWYGGTYAAPLPRSTEIALQISRHRGRFRAANSGWVPGTGCRVPGAGCRVPGTGCRSRGLPAVSCELSAVSCRLGTPP
ncbi:MAG TPA: hypothetical protein DCY40_02320 [Actinobacteria bacterium]|nr:hypothetical protein [Actinomycetota bacterium]